jgi:NIMA-interacting peptidyl-prolyl cis-trans isomerase 1
MMPKRLSPRLDLDRNALTAAALRLLLVAATTFAAALAAGCDAGDTDRAATDEPGAAAPAAAPDQAAANRSVDAPDGDAADREAAASHILIMYAGSQGAGPEITRTRAEADDAARRAHVLLRTDRASFEELARKYSDDRHTRDRGGYIGIFRRGEMTLPFERVVFGLEVGQISGVIETPYGFHVIRREPVRRYRLHHVLVAWQEARKNATRATRSHREAAELAERIRKQADRDPDDLCQLARKYSDDPSNRDACGDLGWIEPGMLAPEIEAVVFKLRPGGVSPVVESPYGFHVFWRGPE